MISHFSDQFSAVSAARAGSIICDCVDEELGDGIFDRIVSRAFFILCHEDSKMCEFFVERLFYLPPQRLSLRSLRLILSL